MPDDGTTTRLVKKRYLSLVIRLLVDGHGDLQQGVLVDLHEEMVGQFRQLEQLPDLITHYLENRIDKEN